MKIFKKAVAVIICLCTFLSFASLCASAEDDVILKVIRAEVLDFKQSSPGCVTRVALELGTLSGEEILPQIPYDSFDENAEIEIYHGYSFSLVYNYNDKIREGSKDAKAIENIKLGTAKPVSLDGNVLTIDIRSRDGEEGIVFCNFIYEDSSFDTGYNKTVFVFGEGFFANEDDGTLSVPFGNDVLIDGITKTVSIKLDPLMKALTEKVNSYDMDAKEFFKNEPWALLGAYMMVMFLPVSCAVILYRTQKAFIQCYDIDITRILFFNIKCRYGIL